MTRKVNITLDEEVLDKIDQYADIFGLSRSAFISMACCKFIDAENKAPNMRNVFAEFFRLTGSAINGKISPAEYKSSLDDLQIVLDDFS